MKQIKKALVIDGQVFQSDAWDRGMGKYSLNLLIALGNVGLSDYDKVYMIFNDIITLKPDAENAIKKALPAAEFMFLSYRLPDTKTWHPLEPFISKNQMVVDKFIRGLDSETVDFVILALFIDQVCSVFPALEYVKRVLLFYDLIPFQYPERYASKPNYANYIARYGILYEADLIWTISQTVADDLAIYLGMPCDRLVNIDGAAVKRSQLKAKKPDGVPKRFVLMPTGEELRKNNIRATKAFADYCSTSGQNDLYLIATSFFSDGMKQTMSKIFGKCVFTGNVTEEELAWLYRNSEAVLFVPEYEGLGLPVLEAMEFNKPIICSDISVFREMSNDAFYYADYRSIRDIAKAIDKALAREDFSTKTSEYPAIQKHYTWGNTAEVAKESLANLVDVDVVRGVKPKIAIFSPNPSSLSTIGKFTMLLHPELSRHFDIDYYLEDGITGRPSIRIDLLSSTGRCKDANTFSIGDYKKYDAVIYHIGSSEFHVQTVLTALALPGIGIMHDLDLKWFYDELMLKNGYFSRERVDAEGLLDKKVHSKGSSRLVSLANCQKGCVVHSNYAQKAVSQIILNDNKSVTLANLAVSTPKLDIFRSQTFRVGFAGIINARKGLDVVEQIASSDLFDDLSIEVFGASAIDESYKDRLNALDRVNVSADITDFQFQSKLQRTDVVVNYRLDYHGETSYSVLEAMRFGVVPIVRNIGWFSELPDDAAVKVNSMDDILLKMLELYSDRSRLRHMSAKAKEYTRKYYSFKEYSKALLDMVSGLVPGSIKDNKRN
ncbi:MAG: glycosyltransferase [Candidatus Nomurabacteria bacterium]|nr:glycosyltransferase [Candidatus Nomurabacteria bacterium]